MVPSGFRRFLHLRFINQFSKMWHRLASKASNKKGAKIEHDSSGFYLKVFFQNMYQTKAEFKNLDDSEVLKSDFPGLWTSAVSMTSTASTTSTASASFWQKKYWSWWFYCSWHPNDQYWSLLVKWIIKNPNLHWYLHPLCRRLLRPTNVTFLKTGWWNSNVRTSWSQ